ncbi:MAG: hypothetical protein M3Y06_01540 [Actinomycetota bacterium]|nr:hypothetical protein [Actinomycetota bacterium]
MLVCLTPSGQVLQAAVERAVDATLSQVDDVVPGRLIAAVVVGVRLLAAVDPREWLSIMASAPAFLDTGEYLPIPSGGDEDQADVEDEEAEADTNTDTDVEPEWHSESSS